MEALGLEDEESGSFAPVPGTEPRLGGEMVKHLLQPPALFRGDLRKEHGAMPALLQDHAVAAQDNVSRTVDLSQGRQDGDLKPKSGEFAPGHRDESRIARGRGNSVAHDPVAQRLISLDVADTSAQAPVAVFQGDKDAAVFPQHRLIRSARSLGPAIGSLPGQWLAVQMGQDSAARQDQQLGLRVPANGRRARIVRSLEGRTRGRRS